MLLLTSHQQLRLSSHSLNSKHPRSAHWLFKRSLLFQTKKLFKTMVEWALDSALKSKNLAIKKCQQECLQLVLVRMIDQISAKRNKRDLQRELRNRLLERQDRPKNKQLEKQDKPREKQNRLRKMQEKLKTMADFYKIKMRSLEFCKKQKFLIPKFQNKRRLLTCLNSLRVSRLILYQELNKIWTKRPSTGLSQK